MFTGIVKEIGEILEKVENAEGIKFKISSKDLILEINIDDSVAVDGCCQTVVDKGQNYFWVQAVRMTLEKTTFSKFKPGSLVNLELAMRASDRLGSHFVTGHVNDIVSVVAIKSFGENREIVFKVNGDGLKYLVLEGSVTINGVGLTVAAVDMLDNYFTVSLIPHTLEKSNLGQLKVNDTSNIEYDVLIKFVENLIFFKKSHSLPLNV